MAQIQPLAKQTQSFPRGKTSVLVKRNEAGVSRPLLHLPIIQGGCGLLPSTADQEAVSLTLNHQNQSVKPNLIFRKYFPNAPKSLFPQAQNQRVFSHYSLLFALFSPS
jgi:hypothetical protein